MALPPLPWQYLGQYEAHYREMFFKVLSIQPLGTPHCLCNKIRTPFCGLQGPTLNGLVFLLPVTHASHQPGTFWPQIFTSGHPLAGDQHFTAPSPVRVPWSTPLASPHTSRHSPHHPGSLSLYAQSTEIVFLLTAHCAPLERTCLRPRPRLSFPLRLWCLTQEASTNTGWKGLKAVVVGGRGLNGRRLRGCTGGS